jgi:hypothetical protein
LTLFSWRFALRAESSRSCVKVNSRRSSVIAPRSRKVREILRNFRLVARRAEAGIDVIS